MLQEVNIDIAILQYTDQAKTEPMYEHRFVPISLADNVPTECTECNEYEVWYTDTTVMNDLIVKLTKKSQNGTKAISGQVMTVGNQLMYDKYKVFRFTPQHQSINAVLPRLVAAGGYVAPITTIGGNSFVVTSSRDFPRELKELAMHSMTTYVKIIDRRTFAVTLKSRVEQGQHSRETIGSVLKLQIASESQILILTSTRNTPWTTISYDNATTVVGNNYSNSQQYYANATTRDTKTVYITGFETILTAAGVEQFLDYYLNTTCKLVSTEQKMGDKEVQARFLHPVKLGPGEAWLKTLAITTTDTATIEKLKDEAARVDCTSGGRYQHLTYEHNATEILRLTEYSVVIAQAADTEQPEEARENVEEQDVEGADEHDHNDGHSGYHSDDQDQEEEAAPVTTANKFSALFEADDEEEEDENDILTELPARQLRPRRMAKGTTKRKADEGDFDTTNDTVVTSYIATKQQKGIWPTPSANATNKVFTNALVRLVSKIYPKYHSNKSTDSKNWHRVTAYFSSTLEAKQLTLSDVAAKLNKASADYDKNNSMTTSMVKQFGQVASKKKQKKKASPAVPKRTSQRLTSKPQFDIDLTADTDDCNQPGPNDPASYLINEHPSLSATVDTTAPAAPVLPQTQSHSPTTHASRPATASSSSNGSSSNSNSDGSSDSSSSRGSNNNHNSSSSSNSSGSSDAVTAADSDHTDNRSVNVFPLFQSQRKRALDQETEENGKSKARHKLHQDTTISDDDTDMDTEDGHKGADGAALSCP